MRQDAASRLTGTALSCAPCSASAVPLFTRRTYCKQAPFTTAMILSSAECWACQAHRPTSRKHFDTKCHHNRFPSPINCCGYTYDSSPFCWPNGIQRTSWQQEENKYPCQNAALSKDTGLTLRGASKPENWGTDDPGPMQNIADKYSVTSIIRDTPLSILYRGHATVDGTPVVIKAMRAEYPTEVELARLRHEYRVIKSLSLPGVVRSFGIEQTGNSLALVLEDVGDRSLDSVIASGEIDTLRALRVSISLARVLQDVHRRGIVHKDIKPEHFFLVSDDSSQVKLIDFGLATQLPRELQTLEPSTQLEGSLPYMAPEQTGRVNRAVDRRADLYSLGVTLYELFSGKRPFETEDWVELVHSHIARVPKPLHEARSEIPAALSDIVARLLQKEPEQRYQSAAGLVWDLEHCLEQLESVGQIQTFGLASKDRTEELRIPERAYGRDTERKQLLDAFDRVSQGATELMLIGGYSGIGKSALVGELKPSLLDGGYLARGKFDYLNRAIPYAAIAEACGGVVRALLSETTEELALRTRRILEAVGDNGQVIVDLVPELELIIGKQKPAAPIGPGESQRRFELVFQSFLGAVADQRHPLVLFFDDLQWADAASLRLIQVALTGNVSHLLVLGAFRNNETDAAHPLWLVVDELREANCRISTLELGPLSLAAAGQLLADSLHTEPGEVGELAETLIRKTQGNPFYLVQLLGDLHREGLLHFDGESGAWKWDLAGIDSSLATDDVVDFLLERLKRLDPASRRALQHAACIGHEFDTQTLALISERRAPEVNQALWPALREGLLIPLDGNYALLDPELDQTSALQARYRFLHDRVQQAAYALVGESDRQQAHLSIARHLLTGTAGAAREERLFDIVDHFNRAASVIDDPEEKATLARLNLEAGEKARQAAAPQAAALYYTACLEASASDWAEHFDVVYKAHLGKSGCDLLLGNLDEAMRLLDAAEEHATTALQRVPARRNKIVALIMLNRLEDACATAVETVRMLGLDIPDPTDKAALGAAIQARFGAFQGALAERDIKSFADFPPMTDETQLAIVNTIATAIPASFLSNQELNVLFVVEAAQAPLLHGTAPASPFFYAQYGIVHIVVTGDTKTAFQFGELALGLSGRPEHMAMAAQVHFLYASFLSHWQRHISDSYEHFRVALKLGLATGDLAYSSYSVAFESLCRVICGTPLVEVQRCIETGQDMLARSEDVITRMFLELARRAVDQLTGWFPDATEDFDTAAFEQHAPPPGLAVHGTLKAMTSWLEGKTDDALQATEQFPPLPASFYTADFLFYRALSLAAAAEATEGGARRKLIDQLEAEAAKLRDLAENAPGNHGQRAVLIQAEQTRLAGDELRAMELYDEAINKAQEGGFLVHQGIACEQCARMHLRAGRERAARPYITEAHWAFARWGASRKAARLVQEFPRLLSEQLRVHTPLASDTSVHPSLHPTIANATTSASADTHLDLASAIRATEAIASELVLEKVLERLMRALMENAGAQRGTLLLQQDNTLFVEARGQLEPDRVDVGLHIPLGPAANIATTVAQYVARTLETCVVSDAKNDSHFAQDPYVARAGVASVLCLPMLHQGRLTGVLYLENNASTGVFSSGRTELLQFLSAQAAVAVENARLYGEVNQARDKLREANESLEAEVADRTEQLRKTLADLWSEMDLAKKIQTVLLPKDTRVGDFDFAATMIAADQVGGDYYDVVHGDSHDWVLIGDVSGHGVSAGLIMMMVQTAVRSVLSSTPKSADLTPTTMLTLVNKAVGENLKRVGDGQYMTLTALRLEGNRLRFAGLHQDILVYRKERQAVERIETQGTWIGLVDDITGLLEDATVDLDPGDIVLMFTDGVTELRVGEHMLDTSGLVERFEQVAKSGRTSEAIVRSLLGPLQHQANDDDLTLVALRYNPPTPRSRH